MLPLSVELKWELPPIMKTEIPFPPTVFKIHRAVDASGSFDLLDITAGMAYVDKDVEATRTYSYFVTTVWILNDTLKEESASSDTISVTIQPYERVTGTITGTVTDSISGAPLRDARVMFFRHGPPPYPTVYYFAVPQTSTDSLGHYEAAVDTGTYFIECFPPPWEILSMSPLPGHKIEWYKDASDPSHATPVYVAENAKVEIDFDLVRYTPPATALVRGNVSDSLGNPLKGALVVLMHTVQAMVQASVLSTDANVDVGEMATVDGLGCIRGIAWKGLTDSLGNFEATVLAGRSYTALAVKKGFIPQYYDHKDTPAEATIIHVDGNVDGIDFNLNPLRPPPLFSISGSVLDSTGVHVQSRIIIFPLRPNTAALRPRFGYTDSLGFFTLTNIPAGNYLTFAIPFGKYAPAFYKAGAFGVRRWKDADTVKVHADVTGIDIGVVWIHCHGIATLSGVVRSSGVGLDAVSVFAVDASGEVVGYGLTDDSGAYEITNLSEGQITLVVDREGYEPAQQDMNVGATDYMLTRDFALSAVITGTGGGSTEAPVEYTLRQNYPNPFNPSTAIRYSLAAPGLVKLRVYNLLGQEVATLVDGQMTVGEHTTVWNGRDAHGMSVASGIYFYRLEASAAAGGEKFSSMRKMVLVR
jgi:hypothetical protein